jgi:hypothetical protein
MPPIPLPHLRPRATGGAVPPIDRRQRARRMPTRRIPQPLVSLLPRRRKCIQKGTVSVPAIRPQARKRNRPAFASGDHRALTSAQSAHCAAYSRTSRCVEGWLRSSGLLLIWRTSGRSCLGNLVSIFRIEEATQTGPLLPTARFQDVLDIIPVVWAHLAAKFRKAKQQRGWCPLALALYFSVTSGKMKGSHRLANVIHASRWRL